MEIAHFFNVEFVGTAFDTYADVLAFEAENGSVGQVMEVWQTEDGAVFHSAAEAEQYAKDQQSTSFDWDGYNMRMIEQFGYR